MPHLSPTPSRSHELHGVTFTPVANSGSGAAELAAWTADFPPVTPGAAHAMSREELLHVLAGTLDVEIDDTSFAARAGDTILVPAGSRFRISNTAPVPARAWVTTSIGMTAMMSDGGQHIVPPWAQ